jgi:hypothetical protein
MSTTSSAEHDAAQESVPGYSLLRRKMIAAKVATQRTLDMLFDPSPIQEMSRRLGIKTFFMEGGMDAAQYEWIGKFFADSAIHTVVQTGFNAGHSAFTFADHGAVSVTSFDINEHAYVRPAHEYLINRFPQTQFQLVFGDSTKTVPSHRDEMRYDVAFIDGGHSQAVAESDLAALRRLVKPGGYVVMDDYGDTMPWQIGPTLAYNQAVSDGMVIPISVERTTGSSGWALGQYAA